MILAALALAASMAQPAQQAHDYFATGNGLQATCAEDGPAYNQGACLGFIVGATSMALALDERPPAHKRICLPDGVYHDQLRDVVLKYIQENPARRQWRAEALTYLALATTFPCSVK